MRKILHKLHLWAGLTLCLPLILLGLSGSVLVWQHQLQDLFNPPPVAAAGAPHNVSEILNAAADVADEGFTPSMYRPAVNGGMATVFLARAGKKNQGGAGRKQILIDPVSLAVRSANASGGFMRQILLFHSSLLLRDYGGRSIVGWFGVVMIMFGLTGVVLWWPRPGQVRNAFKVNTKSRGWKFFRDLHGAAGIWSVLILIIVSSSGVYLAFPQTMNAAVSGSGVRDMRAPPSAKIAPVNGQQALNVDEAIGLAQDAVPDSHVVNVMLPSQPDQPYRIVLARAGAAESDPAINIFVDPWRKRIMEMRDPRDYSIVETVVTSLHAVHAGKAFGWPWRILVFICGLLPLLFAFTGISMWVIRKR